MKILIFLDHDVMIRHFVDSGVFNSLVNRHKVVFVFPEGHKRVTRNLSNLKLNTSFVSLSINQKRLKIWKRLYQVSSLRFKLGRQSKALRICHRAAIGWKASIYYTILGIPGLFYFFKRSSLSRISKNKNKDFEELLSNEKPDLLIHPSVLEGLFINDLVMESKDKEIPLIVIMNSWDNPSSKRAMIGEPDWMLVWGEQTRNHAIEYAKMDMNRAIIFGAAQFDVYKQLPKINRIDFCKIHEINHDKTILLYAGSSKGTDEYSHLVLIDEAIERGIFTNLAVVYRPHPWGNGGKGGERILKHSWKNVCIESTLITYLQQISSGDESMSYPDYMDTHNVLSSVDIIVSPLSTILIEGALHGKPVLCFMPMEEVDARHFQLDLSFVHFQDMFNMKEFLIAKGSKELLPKIHELIEKNQDLEFKNSLNEATRYFVESFETPYGERLVNFCENLIDE